MAQTSMKRSELESLGDGDRISVGSKEVELGDPISTNDFLSGRCFDTGGSNGGSATAPGSSTHATPAPSAVKPFKNPMGNGGACSNVTTNSVVVTTPSSHVAAKIYQ